MPRTVRVALCCSTVVLLTGVVSCSGNDEDESQKTSPACASETDKHPSEQPISTLSSAVVVDDKPVVLTERGDGSVAEAIDPSTAKPCDTLTLPADWRIQAITSDESALLFVAASGQEGAVAIGRAAVTDGGFGEPELQDPIDELADDPPYEMAVASNGNVAVRTDSQVAAVVAEDGSTVSAAPSEPAELGDPTDPSNSAEAYKTLAVDDQGFAVAVYARGRSAIARYGWGGTRHQEKLQTPKAGDVPGPITHIERTGGSTLVLCSGAASSVGSSPNDTAGEAYLAVIDSGGHQTTTTNVRTLAVGPERTIATTTYDGAVRTFTVSDADLVKTFSSPAGTATGGVASDGPHLYMLSSDGNGGTATHITRVDWDFHDRRLAARSERVAIDRLAEAPGPVVTAFTSDVSVIGVSDAAGAVIPTKGSA